MRVVSLFVAALALFIGGTASAQKLGAPAPAFELKDASGKTRSLAEFKGKTVVLEWTNPGCPCVEKFYGPGAMQALQKRWTDKGVVWLSVNSSAAGKEGHMQPAEAQKWLATEKATPTAYLLDADGKVGHAYGAKATPHMYVIDAKGNLVYAGAIDDKPTTNPADIPGAKNYVSAALEEVLAGKPVTTAATTAYGCGVKYAK